MGTRAELVGLRQRNRAAEAECELLREEMAANGERIAVLTQWARGGGGIRI